MEMLSQCSLVITELLRAFVSYVFQLSDDKRDFIENYRPSNCSYLFPAFSFLNHVQISLAMIESDQRAALAAVVSEKTNSWLI